MRIYRDHRFATASRPARGKVDPRLDTFALILIMVDLILLGIFAVLSAKGQVAGDSPNRLTLRMTMLSAIPCIVGLGLWSYMRGKAYLFALPLLCMSVFMLPVVNYVCGSYLAKPLVPYTSIEFATRRSYALGSKTVTVHVYPGSREAVPVLIRVLQDPQSPSRSDAVRDAGLIGPLAAEAVPYLDQILRERDREMSYQAGQSLVKIGGPGINALIDALQAEQDRIRLAAIVALQNAGPDGKTAIPELEKMWAKSDPAMRSQIDIAVTNLRRQRDRS
jgi:HEAT repeat protein